MCCVKWEASCLYDGCQAVDSVFFCFAVQDTLEKVVNVFLYIADKDLFLEFYRKQLAKRLLLQRSASDDSERSLIQKLKAKHVETSVLNNTCFRALPCTCGKLYYPFSAALWSSVHVEARGHGD